MKKQELKIFNLTIKLKQQLDIFKNGNYSDRNIIRQNIRKKIKHLKDLKKKLYFENCNELFLYFSKGYEIFFENSWDEYNKYRSIKLENNKLISTYYEINRATYTTDEDNMPYYIFREYYNFYIKDIK